MGFINHLITGGPHLVWISNSGFVRDVTLNWFYIVFMRFEYRRSGDIVDN